MEHDNIESVDELREVVNKKMDTTEGTEQEDVDAAGGFEAFQDQPDHTTDPTRKRRLREVDVDGVGDSNFTTKKARTPNFLPPELRTSDIPVTDGLQSAKEEIIKSYFNSCNDFGASSKIQEDVVYLKTNNTDDGSGNMSNLTTMPTTDTFWRHGEEVKMNDGDDGLSTDYDVKHVFVSIMKTLCLLFDCRNNPNIKNKRLVKTLNSLGHNMAILNSNSNDVNKDLSMAIIRTVKTFMLALETLPAAKIVANQLYPTSCCVSNEYLRQICNFNSFGAVNDYGFMECKFYIPIQLIFIGNLRTRTFNDSVAGDTNVYSIDLCTHFGPYFYEFLERIYEVCFEMLNCEVTKWQVGMSLRNERRSASIDEMKSGNISSLMRLQQTSGVYSSGYQSSSNGRALQNSSHYGQGALDGFFQDLPQLKRRDPIRIVGTSGRMNSDSRLRYISYNSSDQVIDENDPEEYAEALFVSSFIRFRINQDGQVFMDVYTRHALQLVTE
jgi:hypothetical protein